MKDPDTVAHELIQFLRNGPLSGESKGEASPSLGKGDGPADLKKEPRYTNNENERHGDPI